MSSLKILVVVALIACDLPTPTPKLVEASGNMNDAPLAQGPQAQTINLGERTNPGFESCANKFEYNGQEIGWFSFCQHATTPSRFQVIFQRSADLNPNGMSGTCFIPMFRHPSGDYERLGIAECVHNKANTAYTMTLTKEMVPPDFISRRSEPINAVMIVKADAANQYMRCMNAKKDYILSFRESPTNPYSNPCCFNRTQDNKGYAFCTNINPVCIPQAEAFATKTCDEFKRNHSTQYKIITL